MLTPLVLAVWIMGDGSGMRDGGFKLSSHSFTKEDNALLCTVLKDKYGIQATVHRDRGYYHVYVWKRSTKLVILILFFFFFKKNIKITSVVV